MAFLLDSAGACCGDSEAARLDKDGGCCAGGVLDGDGACCVSGTLDACNVCDGTAVVVDVTGACGAGALRHRESGRECRRPPQL